MNMVVLLRMVIRRYYSHLKRDKVIGKRGDMYPSYLRLRSEGLSFVLQIRIGGHVASANKRMQTLFVKED